MFNIKAMEDSLSALWASLQKYMRMELTSISYRKWVDVLTPLTVQNNVLVVECPDENTRETLKNFYIKQLRDSLKKADPRLADVLLVLPGDRMSFMPKEDTLPESGFCLNSRYTFDTFVVGKSNYYAHAACLAVAENPGQQFNPLFLYGGVGLGKTHLMHAIGHQVRKNKPGARVLYTTSENFTNDLIESLRTGKNVEFRQKFRNLDLLMIDDVQFIINKQSVQEEFFNTFNALHNAGKQIVISADRNPNELTTLEERLRTRLLMGLTADIQKPDEETRIAILKNKAQQDHITVDDTIIRYIAEHIESNIRELEGCLTRVNFYANINKHPITMELAMEALKDILPQQKKKLLTADTVLEAVCDYYSLSKDKLLSKRRDMEVVIPRQVVMYLCHELLSMPFKQIATLLGRDDHTTAISGCKKIESLIKSDSSFKSTLEDLKSRLV